MHRDGAALLTDALALAVEAAETLRALHGDQSWERSVALNTLGVVLLCRGEVDAAAAALSQVRHQTQYTHLNRYLPLSSPCLCPYLYRLSPRSDTIHTD